MTAMDRERWRMIANSLRIAYPSLQVPFQQKMDEDERIMMKEPGLRVFGQDGGLTGKRGEGECPVATCRVNLGSQRAVARHIS